MRMTLRLIALALLLAGMPAAGWSQSQTPQQDLDNAARLAQEALQRMLRALQATIDNLPQFEPPEILPNGDIIIRRVRPKRAPDAPAAPPLPPPGKSGDDVKT